jgi:hypothetical protein
VLSSKPQAKRKQTASKPQGPCWAFNTGYQLSISLIFDTRKPTHTLPLLLLLLAPLGTCATS